MKKQLAIVLLGLCLTASAAFAQDAEPASVELDAASIVVTIYKVALSTSNLCTNPTVIFESATGVPVDIKQAPTLAKGKIPNGTYACVLVEIGKMITTAASTTQDGNPNTTCTTAASRKICADGQASQMINGTAVTCAAGQDTQHVTLFFTTLSANTAVDTSGANTLLPPQSGGDTTHGFNLSSAIAYPANKKARLRLKKKIIASSGCVVIPKPSILVE
jgi:hypothetical protein